MSSLFKRQQPLGGTAGALKRYRVMAFIVGTGLALLCFVGIPLQVIGGNKWPWTAVVQIVGPIHGIFYIVYLLTCLDLAGRARFRTVQLLGMVCSGFVPLLAFYTEAKVSERVRRQLALGADAPPGPAATIWAVLSGQARAQPAGGGEGKSGSGLAGDRADGPGTGETATVPPGSEASGPEEVGGSAPANAFTQAPPPGGGSHEQQ